MGQFRARLKRAPFALRLPAFALGSACVILLWRGPGGSGTLARGLSFAVYPLTWLETRVSARATGGVGANATAVGAACPALVAAHRGNARGGQFTDNSRESVADAVRRGIAGIEVDLTVFEDGAVLEHDEQPLPARAAIRDYEKIKGRPAYRLEEFLAASAPRFRRVIFDLKRLHASRERAVELLRGAGFRPEAHQLISLNCPLMTELQSATGVPAGCELQGVAGNRLLGLRVWSASYNDVSRLQLWLNGAWAGLKPVFWTYPAPADLEHFCPPGLETALIEVI